MGLEKKQELIRLRKKFIHMVNSDKSEWNELTYKEKRELDKICKRHQRILQY